MKALILFVVLVTGVRGWWFFDTKKCYPDVGCFDNKYPFHNALRLVPSSPSTQNVQFWLYTRKNKKTFDVLKYNDDESINKSNFDKSFKTNIIIHGFNDRGDKFWINKLKDTILDKDNVNVIVVNWKDGARPPNFYKAMANSRVVGALLALLIKKLKTVENVSFGSFYLIGHSLGAQVAGYAGERIKGLGRITGLDPAGPGFEKSPPKVDLDKTDAKFVDIIHTDAEPFLWEFGLGTQKNLGHVDFYPNGGKKQPGCPKKEIKDDEFDLGAIKHSFGCSHARAIDYFIASVEGRVFKSYPCASKKDYDAGKCDTCGKKGCAYMGYYADKGNPSGTYYTSTGPNWPKP